MALPYSEATSGERAIADIQKILRGFGCTKFAQGTDWGSGEVFVQFEHMGRMVNLKASAKGYAVAWLKQNPWNSRRSVNRQKWEAKALSIGSVAVYSILRDWVKGQTTAIEVGIMTFEAAFLSHIMLPSGLRVIEHLEQQNLLPPPAASSSSALSSSP